jgi:DHA2 family multidrug resistance protein-like MFS transporter
VTALDDAPITAGKREWLGLATLTLPIFIVSIDLFVLLLALPKIATDLNAGANQQLWMTDIYGFVLAGFLVTMGTLGDRIGRRKLLLIGSVGFGIGSILCAYSTSAPMLIGARAVLAIAGATLMPSVMGLIVTMFKNPKQMGTAFGVFASVFTLGAIVGPIIGGIMLQFFWWGSVFLLGVPVMVLLLIVGPKLLPEASNPQAGKLDLVSVLLSLLALLPTIYGIKELARHGWAVVPLVTLVLGLAFGVAFVRRQKQLAHPLLDLRLFKNAQLSASMIGMLAYSGLGGGFLLLMPLYFQLVRGWSTLQTGLAVLPGMVAGVIGFMLAPKLASRFRPGYVIAVGLVGAAIGYVIMNQFTVESGVLLIVGNAVQSIVGVSMPGLGNQLIVSSAPPEQASSAGSLAQMANEFGSTLGLAIYGTIAGAVYRGVLNIPAGTPANVRAGASDSLAGAATATAGLPKDQAAAVLNPAHEAFVTGMHVAAIVGIIVLLLVAVQIAVRLRHVRPFGQQEAAAA